MVVCNSEVQRECEYKDFLKGGARELSSGVLMVLVKEFPSGSIFLQIVPDDIDDSYVTAFINGFAESNVEPAWLFKTIRRFSAHPQRNIRRTIAWAVEKTTSELPPDIIALLENYLQCPPGEDELWWSKGENHGDLLNSYLNSDRGSAFDVLMRIWSKSRDSKVVEKKWSLIEFATKDPSVAMRAGAIYWMTSLITYDRNRAILLFEELINGYEILLTLMSTRECLYWIFFKNFLRLAPYMRKMMNNENETVQEQGAQLVCIAAISTSALEF